MKSITEFAMPTLQKFSTAKAALTTEGKSAEEISAAMGETFKLEGDKLKYMMAAADLAAGKPSVRRVMVVSFAEGETAPAKYQKVEETHYLVETLEPVKVAPPAAPAKGGRGGGGGPRKGGGGDRPKSSPWGASPEEIAAKKKASIEAAKAKKA